MEPIGIFLKEQRNVEVICASVLHQTMTWWAELRPQKLVGVIQLIMENTIIYIDSKLSEYDTFRVV